MQKRQILILKITISLLILIIAIFRLIFFEFINEKMDLTFLILILAAFIIPIFPWERIQSFKAGGIDVSLDIPQIEGAIKSVFYSKDSKFKVDNKELQQKLRKIINQNAPKIELIKGSRILWIDDHPYNIIGERRLIRALGAEIIMANSSEMAEEKLIIDSDFDIIITDVQRKGQSFVRTKELIKKHKILRVHEGVNFIVKLRLDPNIFKNYEKEVFNKHEVKELSKKKDPYKKLKEYVKSLPVIFYAAYKWKPLVRWTHPARIIPPESKICNSIDDLLSKVIITIADGRSNPINIKVKKTPTKAK